MKYHFKKWGKHYISIMKHWHEWFKCNFTQVRSVPSLSNQYRVRIVGCRLWQLLHVTLWQAWSENSEHNSVLRQENRLEMKILFKVDTYARPTKLLRESFIQRVKAALLGSFRNILSCGNFSPVLPSPLPFLNKNFYEPVFNSKLQKAYRGIGSYALQCPIHHVFIS